MDCWQRSSSWKGAWRRRRGPDPEAATHSASGGSGSTWEPASEVDGAKDGRGRPRMLHAPGVRLRCAEWTEQFSRQGEGERNGRGKEIESSKTRLVDHRLCGMRGRGGPGLF